MSGADHPLIRMLAGFAARFEVVTIAWDPDNALSGRNPTIVDLSTHRSSGGPACAAE